MNLDTQAPEGKENTAEGLQSPPIAHDEYRDLRNALVSLGYLPENAQGRGMDSDLKFAIRTFQVTHRLVVTGEIDEVTIREVNKELRKKG
jgi:hypothetical protein